jgi:hypothetical protein
MISLIAATILTSSVEAGQLRQGPLFKNKEIKSGLLIPKESLYYPLCINLCKSKGQVFEGYIGAINFINKQVSCICEVPETASIKKEN